jgi:hypothetical protein
MNGESIKCFVALAVGKKDVDEIYDDHLFPVLEKRCDLTVERIDRQQHDDDLNVAIIQKLKDADIALIDLTYARPSVYYEAGFAERCIPVVYTVRRDHLSDNQNTDNEKIHFDLKMKPIESWTIPVNPKFDDNLERKVKFKLRNIIKKRDIEVKIKEEQEKFLVLSLQERYNLIYNIFDKSLQSRKFYVIDYPKTKGFTPGGCLIATKMLNKKCIICVMVVSERITKSQIEFTYEVLQGSRLIDNKETIEEFIEYYYFCSLKTVDPSLISSAIPLAKRTNNRFNYNLELNSHYDKKRTINLYFISPITSEKEAIEKISKLIEQHENKKTNKFVTALLGYYGYRFSFKKGDKRIDDMEIRRF